MVKRKLPDKKREMPVDLKKRVKQLEKQVSQLSQSEKELRFRLKQQKQEKLQFLQRERNRINREKELQRKGKYPVEPPLITDKKKIPKFIQNQITAKDAVKREETRAQISFVVTESLLGHKYQTKTPSKGHGFIRLSEIVEPIAVYLAIAKSFESVAKTQVSANPPSPWRGKVFGEGNNVIDFAGFIQLFATGNLTEKELNQIIDKYNEQKNITFSGEIMITYREVVEVTNRQGNRVERLFKIPGYPPISLTLGHGIFSQSDLEEIRKKLQQRRK